MRFLSWYLWIAPHVLLGICLWGFLRRGHYRRLPWFFANTVFLSIQFAVLLALALHLFRSSSSLTPYRWALVFGDAVGDFLELALIYEIANVLVVSRLSVRPVMRSALRWTMASLLVLAAGTSALLPQINIETVIRFFQLLNFSASLIELGLLITLLLFSHALQISWQSLPAGIALGLGVSASAELSGAALLSVLGRAGYIPVDFIRTGAFHVCVVIWLIYIFLPGKPPSFTGHRPDRTDLEAWDQELQKIVR